MSGIHRKPAIARRALLCMALPLSLAGTAALVPGALAAQTAQRRAIAPSDVYNLRSVGDPQISPDGKWVAYTVSTVDSAKDRNVSHIWMTSWDGAHTIQATSSRESESTPRWSPDGRYLSFLSSRGGADDSQLWLMNRLGGEAEMVSHVKGGISDYAWSPDGKRLVFAVTARAASRAARRKSACG